MISTELFSGMFSYREYSKWLREIQMVKQIQIISVTKYGDRGVLVTYKE